MTGPAVAVLRITREHGTHALLAASIARLRARFDRVVVVGDSALASAAGADARGSHEWQREFDGASLALLANDAWIGPLNDPRTWQVPSDGIAALVDHADSWLLANGAGIARLAAGAPADQPPMHAFTDVDLLVRTAPIVPIAPFAASALQNDLAGLVMPRVADDLAARGISRDMVASDLARDVAPRELSSNLGLVDVVDEQAEVSTSQRLTIAVVLHVHYVEMLDALLDRAALLPEHRLIVTTSDEQRGAALRERLAALQVPGEVRVVASNRGRDVSAFLLGCRDLLEDPSVDLVVKLHSKRSPQVEGPAARTFLALLLDNLLPSQRYASQIVDMFAREPRLGLVMAPMVHAGHPTPGRAWYENRPAALALAKRLGISGPLDEASPIAPYGSMFIARTAALRPLLGGDLRWEEFPTEGEYRDGSLAHVLERLVVPAVLSAGYSFRTVLSMRWAAASHTVLELKLDAAEGSAERRAMRLARRVPSKLSEVVRRQR